MRFQARLYLIAAALVGGMLFLGQIGAGEKTSAQALRQALAFYASIGKKPIVVRTELPGLAASRLSAALCR